MGAGRSEGQSEARRSDVKRSESKRQNEQKGSLAPRKHTPCLPHFHPLCNSIESFSLHLSISLCLFVLSCYLRLCPSLCAYTCQSLPASVSYPLFVSIIFLPSPLPPSLSPIMYVNYFPSPNPTHSLPSRLVQAMSAWLVNTRRAPSRHRRDARVYGHTTTAMHKLSTPPPPPPLQPTSSRRALSAPSPEHPRACR